MAEISTLGAVIATAYEAQPDRNQFTDAEKVKLDNMTGAYADLTGKPALDFVPLAQRGAANGVAPLDAAGLVPLVHLNVGGLSFKGAWNPTTNTPTLIDGTGSVGDFYKASVAGTRNTGNGSFTYAIGDWIIYAGGTWSRLGSTDAVAMVNGKIGSVTLTAADVGAKAASYVPAWSEVADKPALVNTVNGQSGAVTVPAYTPPALTYADRIGSRVASTWYTAGARERIVNISTNYVAASDSSRIEMRAAGTTTPVFSARSQATGTGSTNHIMQAIVPGTWDYRFVPGTSRTVSTWFEGDYAATEGSLV